MRLRLPRELEGGALLAFNSFAAMLLAFPVQILIARQLGPERMGQYALVLSIAFFVRVAVGMTCAQDILIPLYKKDNNDATLGAGWLLLKLTGVLFVMFAAGWLSTGNAPDSQENLPFLVLIVSAAMLFCDHEIYSIWCKSEDRLRDFVRLDLGGTLIGLLLRLLALVYVGTIAALIWTYLLEQVVKTLLALSLYLYRRRPFLKPFVFDRGQLRCILNRGWPIWASAILSVTYLRIDQILLGTLLPDSSELGQYSVAVRLGEASMAAAVALFTIYLPILSNSPPKKLAEDIQRLHDLMLWGSLSVLLILSVILKPLVVLLYGEAYSWAAHLVLFYLLAYPASCLGLARSAYLLAKGATRLELLLKIVGVGLNLTLNLLFIPKYGALAAVASTVAVQWTVSVALSAVLPALKPIGQANYRALQLLTSFKRLKQWIRPASLPEQPKD